MAVYLLFTSPTSFEKAGKEWAKVATLPAAGTGPFRITKVVPRQEADLARWDGYWDPSRKAKVDNVVLMPIPEANSRLAALRSGQVDWIEVPPPDGIALAEIRRLHHHHRLLSACLAVVLQHRRGQQPVQGRQSASGAELLHRSGRAGRRCSTAPRSRRSAGSRPAIPISARRSIATSPIPPRARRCSRKPATRRQSRSRSRR